LKSTDPTSHQRGRPTSTNLQLSKKKKEREKRKNWSRVPDGCLTKRQTGRLTVGGNITLTLILTGPQIRKAKRTAGTQRLTQCPEYNWATLFLGDINMGTWPSRLG
jgi:hypothetical protein